LRRSIPVLLSVVEFLLPSKQESASIRMTTDSIPILETSGDMSSEKVVIGTCQKRVRGTKRNCNIYTTDFI
jgi:hypothetical protein